jgi:hypothetical protein
MEYEGFHAHTAFPAISETALKLGLYFGQLADNRAPPVSYVDNPEWISITTPRMALDKLSGKLPSGAKLRKASREVKMACAAVHAMNWVASMKIQNPQTLAGFMEEAAISIPVSYGGKEKLHRLMESILAEPQAQLAA